MKPLIRLTALMALAAAGPLSSAPAPLFRFDGAAAGDRFGSAVACADLNRDRVPDLIVGAPAADPNGRIDAGSVFIYSGKTRKLLRRLDGPAAFDGLGTALVCADVNRDRVPDIIAGAGGADPGGREDAGSVLVFSGKDGRLLRRIDGEAEDAIFGAAVASGDVNRDGFADLIVGAPYAAPAGARDAGSVFVYSGKNGRLLRRYDGAAGDLLGTQVASCDVNRDRFADMVFTAPEAGVGESKYAGSIFVYSGKNGQLLYRFEDPPLPYGEELEDLGLGETLACGDLDRDGYPDIYAGTIALGSIYIFSGRTGRLLRRQDGRTGALALGDAAVTSCDLDGDRFPETIGSGALPNDPGLAVFIYSGKNAALLRSHNAGSEDDSFGSALTCGDLNRDRTPDVIVGAPLAAPGGHLAAGSVYVYSGKLR